MLTDLRKRDDLVDGGNEVGMSSTSPVSEPGGDRAKSVHASETVEFHGLFPILLSICSCSYYIQIPQDGFLIE